MDNLAVMLSSQGKYEKADAMYGQALALMERVLGKEHPDTLTSSVGNGAPTNCSTTSGTVGFS